MVGVCVYDGRRIISYACNLNWRCGLRQMKRRVEHEERNFGNEWREHQWLKEERRSKAAAKWMVEMLSALAWTMLLGHSEQGLASSCADVVSDACNASPTPEEQPPPLAISFPSPSCPETCDAPVPAVRHEQCQAVAANILKHAPGSRLFAKTNGFHGAPTAPEP